MKKLDIQTFLNKYIYRYIHEIGFKESPYVMIPAALFSLFMVFGQSYEETNSWSLVFGSGSAQFIKACIKFSVYFAVFYYAVCFLYHRFNAISFGKPINETAPGNKKIRLFDGYINLLSRHPFKTSFLSLFIVYIPYIIISYPGIVMPDTLMQIFQMYPKLGHVLPGYLNGHLLSDQVYLNNHHPVTPTLLLYACLQIGAGIFHSYNIGMFLFSLLQFSFLLSAVSYGIKILIEKAECPAKYMPLIILYYIISPCIQHYMFLLTKDIIYAAFLLYFLLFLYLIITGPERRYYILFMISGLGMILFRNEAKYILMISLPVLALLCRKIRKFFLKYWIAVIGFSIVFFRLLLPICNVTPGSTREILSVPFQQTARYIIEYGDEVTANEQDAIDAVLNYSFLPECYFPHLSDFTKATYKEDSTKADLLRYFKVWLQMFMKHPDSYIQATINNYFYYFYPGLMLFQDYGYSGSATSMDTLNSGMESLGTDFHYPSYFDHAREQYETFRHNFMYFPPIVFLMFSATYTWILILLLIYSIYKKIPQAFGLLIVPAFVVLMCLVSPCNGFYFRYIYPIVIASPIMIPLYFSLKQAAQQPERQA